MLGRPSTTLTTFVDRRPEGCLECSSCQNNWNRRVYLAIGGQRSNLLHDVGSGHHTDSSKARRNAVDHIDLFVRVCDVDPRGRSTNLCDGIRRLRPGQPEGASDGTRQVTIDLIGTAHVFRAGHRIRVQVSSGAHPRLVRNLGTGEPLLTATRMQPAHQEVFHDPDHASAVTLPTRIS